MNIKEIPTHLHTPKTKYVLSPEEKKQIQFEGLEKFILYKLNSTKYKASKTPEELMQKVIAKISTSVKGGKPIHITVPFGGYKKWQLPSAPLPDWAEVFALDILIDYLSPIAAAYDNGVHLHFYSDEIFVARMNNYPQEDLDKYNSAFKKLLDLYSKNIPSNMQLEFSKIRDEISQEELMRRFDQTIVELRKKWGSLPSSEKKYRLAKSARNYQGNLSILSKSERNRILFESTLVHDAFIYGDWDKDVPWAFGPDMIAIGYRYTGTWGIHLRSSVSSTVQFWIGTGALLKKASAFLPSILTHNQFIAQKESLELVNIESDSLLPDFLSKIFLHSQG